MKDYGYHGELPEGYTIEDLIEEIEEEIDEAVGKMRLGRDLNSDELFVVRDGIYYDHGFETDPFPPKEEVVYDDDDRIVRRGFCDYPSWCFMRS